MTKPVTPQPPSSACQIMARILARTVCALVRSGHVALAEQAIAEGMRTATALGPCTHPTAEPTP